MNTIEDAVLGATRKLEVLEDLNLDALRAAVRTLQASFLDSGHFIALKVASNLRKELRKLEAIK